MFRIGLKIILIITFSSIYFEGGADALDEPGYSRDGQPGKKQLVFEISPLVFDAGGNTKENKQLTLQKE